MLRVLDYSKVCAGACPEIYDADDKNTGWDRSYELGCSICYSAPGMEGFLWPSLRQAVDNCKDRQMWWAVGNWRPSKELHDSFRGVGEERYGKDGEVRGYWSSYVTGNKWSIREKMEEEWLWI